MLFFTCKTGSFFMLFLVTCTLLYKLLRPSVRRWLLGARDLWRSALFFKWPNRPQYFCLIARFLRKWLTKYIFRLEKRFPGPSKSAMENSCCSSPQQWFINVITSYICRDRSKSCNNLWTTGRATSMSILYNGNVQIQKEITFGIILRKPMY